MTARLDGHALLNAQQRLALEVSGVSVALSAGAGCGKTTVLTSRFVRELAGPNRRPLSAITALTFTEKAARELRERVRSACRQAFDRDEPDAHWHTILRGLEDAPIGTFHSFCGRILRRFAVEAGIDPGFSVLEASVAQSLRDDTLSRLIRRLLALQDADLIAVAVEFGLDSVREYLQDLSTLCIPDDLPRWTEKEPESVVAHWEAFHDREILPIRLSRVVESGADCLAVVKPVSCTHATGERRRRFLLEVLPDLGKSDRDLDALLTEIAENAKVQGGGGVRDWPTAEDYERVKSAYESLRKAVAEFRDWSWSPDQTILAARLGRSLARLTQMAQAEYSRVKRSRGVLDFDDLLLLVRDLLRREGSTVREQLAGEIGLILVDEFQDTDPVQSEIIELLAGQRIADGGLFLVGDYKQSIYRFRGAEPRLFESYRDRFPDGGRLDLTENFRSVAGILDFVNALFAEVFPDQPHLVPGNRSVPILPGTPVSFLWAEQDGEGSEQPSEGERRVVEADSIARVIRERLDSGWPVRDTATGGGATRPAQPGDIVLLFRTLNDLAPYERALTAEGLEYYVVGGAAFYAQQEIHDLINLLSVVEDPLDPVSLAAALRSPFFCLSDEGLFWLADASGGDLGKGLLLASEGGIGQLGPDDLGKARRALQFLMRWRATKDHEPIARTVERVLVESGYEAALMGEFMGDRKRANARKLIHLARQFDNEGGFSLSDFVARMRADLRRPPREEQAATTDEQGQAVRLMTIHQSKGLEFPIVIVPDLNRKPGGTHTRVGYGPDVGILVAPIGDPEPDQDPRTLGESLGWKIYRERERAEEEQEALRLLYVATTRARDYLILSAGCSPEARPQSPALKLLARRFDRATGRFLGESSGTGDSPQVSVIPHNPAHEKSRRPTTPGPTLLEIANAIDHACQRIHVSPVEPVRARLACLDLDPRSYLSPQTARVDRLVRAVLSGRRVRTRRELKEAVTSAGWRLVPPATSGMIEQVVAWLNPLYAHLTAEVAEVNELIAGESWTLAWPPDSSTPTCFSGCVDFAWQGADGVFSTTVVSTPGGHPARERLRLEFSRRVLTKSVRGEVAGGRIIRLGKVLETLVLKPLADHEVEALVEQIMDECSAES